jgi:uncharacterized protein
MAKRQSSPSIRKRLRQGYVRVLRSPGAPREVAGGMALGVFVAMLPVPMQMAIAVLAAELVRRLVGAKLSRVAAAAGVWITNPITAAPLYWLAFMVGRPIARLLLPQGQHSVPEVSVEISESMADLTQTDLAGHPAPVALEIAYGLTIGGVILGVVFGAIAFRITYAVVERYQVRRALRRSRQAAAPPGAPLQQGSSSS